MVKFGFVGTYLSEPLVRAYTTAAAGHAVVAQLKYIFGVSPTRFNGPLSLVYVSTDRIGVQILPSIVGSWQKRKAPSVADLYSFNNESPSIQFLRR